MSSQRTKISTQSTNDTSNDNKVTDTHLTGNMIFSTTSQHQRHEEGKNVENPQHNIKNPERRKKKFYQKQNITNNNKKRIIRKI